MTEDTKKTECLETRQAPRVLIAGSNSGCGKTTVTCAILQALCRRGKKLAAFKCGPDYIDPMFHSRITGGKSANLDLFFFDENSLRALLAKNSAGCDLSVIEGVMGFYDGMGLTSPKASSYEVAKAADCPVVLVVNAKGLSLSLLAVIQGFLTLYPDHHIQGVILNNCGEMTYPALAKAIHEHFGGRVKPLGYLPKLPDCSLESRHLGLVTAAEVEDLQEKLELLGEQAEKTIDLDGLLELAQTAPQLRCRPFSIPKREPVRIAVAKDKAFCFYYGDNLDFLREMGGELVEFSPLSDEKLPENIQGLYLGGGYPELYAPQLEENRSMRASIRQALERKLPCIAECGGFMYLTREIAGHAMVGFLPGSCFDAGKLRRFGYVTLRAKADNMLCRAGEEIRGHEFHRWDCEACGSGFTAEKSTGRSWDCVHSSDTLYAGYPHFHFYANPAFAEGFYSACLKEKKNNA